MQISGFKYYLSVILLYCKPLVGDEEVFLVCLYVPDHDVVQIPGGSFTLAGIVMPDPQVHQVTKVTGEKTK